MYLYFSSPAHFPGVIAAQNCLTLSALRAGKAAFLLQDFSGDPGFAAEHPTAQSDLRAKQEANRLVNFGELPLCLLY